MAQKIITKESFHIVGIKVRTSNQNAIKDIPQVWNKFFSKDIKNKIPNRLNEDIYSVYTEYENDYTKPYSYILGYLVSSLDSIPDEMEGVTIPVSKYEIFIAKGKIPDKVIETWQHIWNSDIEGKRAYKADFEIYSDPENSEVEIYIGLK